MSEENKKIEQAEQVAPEAELSEQDLDKVAGGASQPLVPTKPGTRTGPTYPTPPQGPQGKI